MELFQAVAQLKEKHGISKLDIVIANAAINLTPDRFEDLDTDLLDQTWFVNVRGPLLLFQAVLPLLDKTKSKFVIVSSGSGTIGQNHRSGSGAYGISKAAVNYMVAKLHAEHPDLPILALGPGWVPT